MSGGPYRIQALKQEIANFQRRHSLAPFDLVETEKYRLQINPVMYEPEVLKVQEELKIEFPTEYKSFITGIGNGIRTKYSQLLPLSESVKGTYWDIRAVFPYIKPWNPNYEGLNLNDSPESLGSGEFERRQQWMLWQGDKCHTNGTLLIEDMGCGYSRHLILNGPQRGYVWEDLRAADEGITPTTLHGQPVTFLDFYENEIRHNLRGLDHDL